MARWEVPLQTGEPAEPAYPSKPTPESLGDDVFVTRHGARIDKEDPSWLTRAGHGRRDDPHLSAAGERGAAALADRLAAPAAGAARVRFVVTSPFVRCVQTAHAVAERLDLPVLVEPGVCELLATFPPGLLSLDELARRFPRIDRAYAPVVPVAELRPERGDGEAARRAAKAAAAVRERLGPGPVLFCGHGASCLGIVRAFGGSGYVGYVSLSHFRRESAGWRQVGELGDTSHLPPELARQSRESAF